MEQTSEVAWPRRGEVYVVAFDPTRGAEIKKTRPALIIQNDVTNQWSELTIVAAITTRHRGSKIYRNEVGVDPPEGGLVKSSVIKLNQLRTIDRVRLGRRLGQVSPATLRAVGRALEISLGLWK